MLISQGPKLYRIGRKLWHTSLEHTWPSRALVWALPLFGVLIQGLDDLFFGKSLLHLIPFCALRHGWYQIENFLGFWGNRHELIVPPSEQSKFLDMEEFDEGLRLYYLKQFDLALTLFEKASEKNPGDLLPKIYAIRCNEFIYWPPEDDWDGVYEFKHK